MLNFELVEKLQILLNRFYSTSTLNNFLDDSRQFLNHSLEAHAQYLAGTIAEDIQKFKELIS